MRLKAYAAQTHQGPYLQVNEDGYDFDFENDLYMIFDGFGGSGYGDKAVLKLKSDIKTFYTQISDDPNATMPLYYNPRHLLEGNALVNSVMNAHQNLFKENQDRPMNQRAGASTLVAARADSLMVILAVGSCCAFHFRQGVLTKIISEDTFQYHSQSQIDAKFRTAPMNALGMYHEMGHQVREVRIQEGDKLLFMTDGLYPYLGHEELVHHLNRKAGDAQERLSSLLKLSNNHGNLDNQTGMILEF
jgi:serine/threonine protein phosphatase PrpC